MSERNARNQKLSIIIPARNEARTIGGVITRIRESLSDYDYEIIVVDDGSEDGTKGVATNSLARVVCHSHNLGKGAAMKTGVTQAKGEIVVFVDGDGAHDPQEIPLLVGPIVRGEAALVIGSRAVKAPGAPSHPAVRRLANGFASFTISVIVSVFLPLASRFKLPVRWVRITDCSSGFRAIRRQDWFRLGLVSQRFEVETEMIYQAVRNRLAIKEVPVGRNPGRGTSKLAIGADGLRTFRLLISRLLKDAGTRKW